MKAITSGEKSMVNVYLIVDQIQNYIELPPKTDIFLIALIYYQS